MNNKQKSIKYISECGKLIHYSIKSMSYRVVNDKKPYFISKEDFDKLITKKIKSRDYAFLMNKFYNNIGKVEWIYEGKRYRKLDNFETDGYSTIINYKELPKHQIPYYGNCLLVYHWGEIYYLSNNGCERRSKLIDIHTKESVRWVNPKHCAPIFDIENKKIV